MHTYHGKSLQCHPLCDPQRYQPPSLLLKVRYLPLFKRVCREVSCEEKGHLNINHRRLKRCHFTILQNFQLLQLDLLTDQQCILIILQFSNVWNLYFQFYAFQVHRKPVLCSSSMNHSFKSIFFFFLMRQGFKKFRKTLRSNRVQRSWSKTCQTWRKMKFPHFLFSFLTALLELSRPSIVNPHRSAGLHSFSEHYEW